ncbi:hypothetical protein [Mesorhizobium sp.]|uniref:hypothetical protein n=1 Tax=Mesorhizobium sp. TaxID=1871066 RepID=UPI000FE2E3AA|nr:hypothetical protein [Mesorhizobium sp.]RWN51898.1 MAG: hypothetical protein EOR98_23890 [Mesorhizobium sp.]RWN73092.1 MAG: hypothetical protein EOS02_25705 [Mesorhizobium sp.]RWN76275.1 MAG: hypothetical protein EOS01_21425 [Mesorhizobium sp.]RWN86022.1 MAG: hypothetical protein EOS04_20825 [Mesorhizobium sp.]RWO11786.1 MAG: hypothetical protein EOS15_22050 [Mesorhizobium sp.]
MDEAQTPLSLRWEHRPHWPALRKEYGGSETTAAIILSLVTADGAVSYSRNRNHYVRPRRYKESLYTYAKVTGSADYLDGLGLVHHDKVPPNHRRWQSSMVATPELIERTGKILSAGPVLLIARPRESIILRDADKEPVDYRDTPTIRRMRRRVEEMNEAIRGTLLTGVLPSPMVRIFNRTFNRGGRYYALGGGWQSMSKEARKLITIGGESVVEIDYKTLHPALLYAEAGAALPEDCYAIAGWPRPLAKLGLLVLVNAPTKAKARLAIAHHKEMAPVAEPGSQLAFAAADQLITDVKQAHHRIAKYFHSDKGAELMCLDSAIAETVMHLMLMAGVTVLPVHDSFLVQASKAELLEEAMQRAAYETGIEALQVTFG